MSKIIMDGIPSYFNEDGQLVVSEFNSQNVVLEDDKLEEGEILLEDISDNDENENNDKKDE